MIKEDIYCGLIWDTELNKFVGIFTIRDFLNLIKVLYEKIIQHLENNGKWTNIKSLVSNLFQRNKINLEELDAIMEDDPYYKLNSDCKSEKSDGDMMQVDEEMESCSPPKTLENKLLNYKEFFRIFEYININDYFAEIHPVNV